MTNLVLMLIVVTLSVGGCSLAAKKKQLEKNASNQKAVEIDPATESESTSMKDGVKSHGIVNIHRYGPGYDISLYLDAGDSDVSFEFELPPGGRIEAGNKVIDYVSASMRSEETERFDAERMDSKGMGSEGMDSEEMDSEDMTVEKSGDQSSIDLAEEGSDSEPLVKVKDIEDTTDAEIFAARKLALESSNSGSTLNTTFHLANKHIMEAQNLFYRKKYWGALEVTNKAIELVPSSAQAYALKGSIYYKMGLPKKARMSWESALTRDPTMVDVKQSLNKLGS